MDLHSAVLELMEKVSDKFGVEQTDDMKVLLDLLEEKGVIDQQTKTSFRDYIFENSVVLKAE